MYKLVPYNCRIGTSAESNIEPLLPVVLEVATLVSYDIRVLTYSVFKVANVFGVAAA
jgi:hypothetical protein